MVELPWDLLPTIAKEMEDDPTIFNLRLVSKAFKDVVTGLAFRVVVVRDSVKSALAVGFLQSCDDSVTSVIRELVFYGDVDQEEKRWRREHETSGEPGRRALTTVFSGLSKFLNLKKLQLNFHGIYQETPFGDIPDNPTHFFKLQIEIFTTLAAHPLPHLGSLVVKNLLPIPNEIYNNIHFHAFFRPLHELDIGVLCDVNGGKRWYEQEPLLEFWEKVVPRMVLSASALTALTIRSNDPVGACPAMSFKDLLFPHLTSLSFHRFALEPAVSQPFRYWPWGTPPDSDVADFILRHEATLERLELHDCSIDGVEGNFPRPWHVVLGKFEAELRVLRDFVFESRHGGGTSTRDPRFEYTVKDDAGFGYGLWDEEVPGESLDLSALDSLLAVVKSRRDDKGPSDSA
ncbi:Pribosyltran domain-containing protein [Mycena sanguinolenta]|uniref:Pribosyltran domain-containing protein n=1 Tax=Mycena sanguinolenta TaxID=230812 RepID=A0A8H6XHQ5_9AGAR|nr:Pribosyltran domain-containing protein [Mycena sanguinolenta]